jgi:hypothetical protein
MATGYKYQERDLDSQVNYADIGLEKGKEGSV